MPKTDLRIAGALALLLATGSLAGPSIKEVFDPRTVPLQPYGWDEWEKLPPKKRLETKGIDPGSWEKPPPAPEKPKNPHAPKHPPDRYPGFRFAERLERKKKLFDALLDGLPPSSLAGLLGKLSALDKLGEDFEEEIAALTEEFLQTKEQLDRIVRQQHEQHVQKHGKPPAQVLVPRGLNAQYQRQRKRLQLLLSTQESERQFHAWVPVRFAEAVGALSEDERGRPMKAIGKEAGDRDWRQRVRAATVLAHLGGAEAARIFDAAMAKEDDPFVLAEMIRLRARRRPDGLFEALSGLLANDSWVVRATVYGELGRLKRKEAVDLLLARMEKEEGRLLDDIVDALEGLTGKRFDPDPAIWNGWWKKHRVTWEPPQPGERKGERVVKEGGGGRSVSFYGIRTHSKRIVFCLDLSGSMAFPLDGQDGKKDPRIVTARAQMEKALRSLPDDAVFTIVTYSEGVEPWKKKLVSASDRNKQKAWAWVEKREPDGSTNIYDALMLSLRIAEGRRGESADTIFFLTDGVPTHGRVIEPAQILAEITARNRRVGVVIHAVGVSDEQNAAFLLNLARANGGRYVGHR